MNIRKINIISLIITIIFAGILYYFFLPAINLHAIEFWIYLILVVGMFSFSTLIASVGENGAIKKMITTTIFGFSFLGIIILGILLVNIIVSPLFNSRSYSKRIEINENANFTDEVKSVDFSKLPLLDKDSSQKLGDRVMGQMPEMVSQYYVSD